jgi:hypothetical protein
VSRSCLWTIDDLCHHSWPYFPRHPQVFLSCLGLNLSEGLFLQTGEAAPTLGTRAACLKFSKELETPGTRSTLQNCTRVRVDVDVCEHVQVCVHVCVFSIKACCTLVMVTVGCWPGNWWRPHPGEQVASWRGPQVRGTTSHRF